MLLRVEELRTCIETPRGLAIPVDRVSLEVAEGETHALVGESGCGKSMTALSVMQLLPEPGGYVDSGRVLFEGRDLLDLTWTEMARFRGRHISMVFQEPMTSLNPALTVGRQVEEAARVHGKSLRESSALSSEILDRVGLTGAERQYPHELSGGMRQRVMIAMALINRPKLLIADEPTTALDVTIQAQILRLIHELQRERGMSVLIITHDLAVVAEIADSVSVMYAGKIVEQSGVADLFASPKHPYTRDLLASLPGRNKRGSDLGAIGGVVPDPTRWPGGCRYAERCRQRLAVCSRMDPEPLCSDGREISCHLYDGGPAEGTPKS